MLRLIDLYRTERLCRSFYLVMRNRCYSDDLIISEDELKKLLGVTDLRRDDNSAALAEFHLADNSQILELIL